MDGKNKIIEMQIDKTLGHLVNKNEEFIPLLLFIGLLDSQNIPKDLLYKYKGNLIVDDFIDSLKKFSVITHEFQDAPFGSVFSLDKAFHSRLLKYLQKDKALKEYKENLQDIFIVFENHTNNLIEKIDLEEINFFITHCKVFVTHKVQIPSKEMTNIYGNVGKILYYLREDLKAKTSLEEGLVELESEDPKNHKKIATSLIFLANINMELGNNLKAKNLLDNLRNNYPEYLNQDIPDVARSLAFMGDIYVQIGDYSQAQKMLEKSIKIHKKHKDSIGLARALGFQGNVFNFLEDYKQAKDVLEQSFLLHKECQPDNSIGFAWVLIYLGNACKGLGEYSEAQNFIEKGINIYKENFPKNHADTAWAMLSLADLYICIEDLKKAREIFDESYEIHKLLFKKDNVRMYEALLILGKIYNKKGDSTKANEIFKEILSFYKNTYENHPIVDEILILSRKTGPKAPC